MAIADFEDGGRDHMSRNAGASRSWNRRENSFPLERPERKAAILTCDFSPVRPTSDLWKCKRINLCCCKTLSLW